MYKYKNGNVIILLDALYHPEICIYNNQNLLRHVQMPFTWSMTHIILHVYLFCISDMARILHFTEITLIIIMIDSHKWNNPVSQTQMQQSNTLYYCTNVAAGQTIYLIMVLQ